MSQTPTYIKCVQCGTPMQVTGKQGNRRPKRCSKECKAAAVRAKYAINEAKPCNIDGCAKNRNQSRSVCNTHAMRSHRYGDASIDRTRTGRPWTHSNGYTIIGVPGHPLAQHDGGVYEHRKTLWDSIGPGRHECHWCHEPVEWMTTLEVDHLDNVRSNNDPSNLVPACHGCNTRRAMHKRWHTQGDCVCPLGKVFDAVEAACT